MADATLLRKWTICVLRKSYIPWNQVSRINGQEIRDLMLGIEKDLETSLRTLALAEEDQIPVVLEYIKKIFLIL